MEEPIVVKIRSKPHLTRFLEALYGPQPISFPRRSNFNLLLNEFVEKPVPLHEPCTEDHCVLVSLPTFEDKDIRSYNFISEKRQRIFMQVVYRKFKITFRTEISKSIMIGLQKQQALELFIEKYNLSLDCWEMLDKDYRRYLILRRVNRLNRTKKNFRS